MKIEINNQHFLLDVDKAKHQGVLIPVPSYPLVSGDVYVSNKASSVLLVALFYKDNQFILTGRDGLNTYSNFNKAITGDEVTEILAKDGYEFSHNISKAVANLINK